MEVAGKVLFQDDGRATIRLHPSAKRDPVQVVQRDGQLQLQPKTPTVEQIKAKIDIEKWTLNPSRREWVCADSLF